MVKSEIHELKSILLDFIKEQNQFNAEQKKFNAEQKKFNKNIDKKIDKVQYYLEETMASHTKMFFEEQMELRSKVNDLNDEVFDLKNSLSDLMTQVRYLQQKS